MEAVSARHLQHVLISALRLLDRASIVYPIMIVRTKICATVLSHVVHQESAKMALLLIVMMELHVRLIFARPLLDYVLAVLTT